MDLTEQQSLCIEHLWDFMGKSKEHFYGVFGYAGTGKTTVIVEFIKQLLTKNTTSLKEVVVTAPTNKAVSVITNKFKDAGIKIIGKTIHKFLRYTQEFDVNGNIVFKPAINRKLIFDKVIVIDECSMINKKMADILFKLLLNNKVIFIGDIAQLPPIGEDKSVVFDKLKTDSVILTDIVRTKENTIQLLSNYIRSLIEKPASLNLGKYKAPCIKYYSKKEILIEKFLDQEDSRIILCWTNNSVNWYNTEVRKRIFNKDEIDEIETNDEMIFTENRKCNISGERKRKSDFTNNEKVKVILTKDVVGKPLRFYISDSIEEYKSSIVDKYGESMYNSIVKRYLDVIDKIKTITENVKFDAFHVNFIRTDKNEEDDEDSFEIYICRKEFRDKLKRIRSRCHDEIYAFKTFMCMQADYRDLVSYEEDGYGHMKEVIIFEEIVKRFWVSHYNCFLVIDNPFKYSYSGTVHRNQGSTYDHVFIDLKDIMLNRKKAEMFKCLYTAVTRSAKNLYFLV